MILSISINTIAQRVGIGTTTPHTSAKVEITSNNSGVLIPRLTTAQRTGINPVAAGLLVYDSDTNSFWYHNGTNWYNLSSTNNSWNTNGNNGTDSLVNFIGTTDAMPLMFRVRNQRSGKIDSASQSTGIGYKSLLNPVGFQNTAFGYKALLGTGSFNTAIGASALSNNTSGRNNTAVGESALLSNTNGALNTALGSGALKLNTSGFQNVAIGTDALANNSTGLNNISIGSGSLFSNTTGEFNIAIGVTALSLNTTGYGNIGIGSNSLGANTSGTNNTAIGISAAVHNQEGYLNTSVGYRTLYWNNIGYYNTAIGAHSMENNEGGQTNSAFGYRSLQTNINGLGNTALGYLSLGLLNAGWYNTAIGYNSGTNAASWNNTISIGNDGTPNAFHNQAFIGNASTAWIGGYVGWSVYSDSRLKTNITEEVKGLDFIMKLRPVVYSKSLSAIALQNKASSQDFEGKYEVEKIRYSGFIAQEVDTAAERSGYNFSGVKKVNGENGLYTLSYESFVVPLVKAMQEQQEQIELLKKQVEVLLKNQKSQ